MQPNDFSNVQLNSANEFFISSIIKHPWIMLNKKQLQEQYGSSTES